MARFFLLTGLAILAVYWIGSRSHWKRTENDYLAAMTFAFLLLFYGACCFHWGEKTLRPVAFPLGLLMFMVPIPDFAMPMINSFLQHGSARAADLFFSLSGTPYFRNALEFDLPNINLQIAPECSGIQSSIVLLFDALVAGHLFLKTLWARSLLTLSVIPLALIRNGFRVFTIGELCVHFGPQMIGSPIHHKGGPLFFVVSLFPLCFLLIFLRKLERKKQQPISTLRLERFIPGPRDEGSANSICKTDVGIDTAPTHRY